MKSIHYLTISKIMRLKLRSGPKRVKGMIYDLAVGSSLIVRPARVQDITQMARVNVLAGDVPGGLMPDAVLDDPGFPAARERMWTAALTDERYRHNRTAVAVRDDERDDELVGIAMSGPPGDATAPWTRQLYVLYVYASDHGTGTGRALLEAVTDPAEPTALWVADPNPRAQAFYRKHDFVPDGTAQTEDGIATSAQRCSRYCQHRAPASPARCPPGRSSGPAATAR